MRQGRVMSPRLLSCVVELARGCWRRKRDNVRTDFHDGMHTLWDLRFADDILLLEKKSLKKQNLC